MTVSVQTPVNSYTANGVTTVFNFTFLLLSSDDLDVYVDDALKTIGIDYTVSGVGVDAGGTVTFLSAPDNGASVVIQRNSDLKRDQDYQENGDFLAREVNTDFDKLWLAMQELVYKYQLAPTLMPGSVYAGQIVLPEPEIGRYLRWNSFGTNLENINSPIVITNFDGVYVPAVADLAATQVQAGQTIYLREYSADTRSGGGALTAEESAEPADGGRSFSCGTPGILLRRKYSGFVDVTKCGADPTDPLVDDYAAFARAMDIAQNEDVAIFVPDSQNYFLDEPLEAFQGLRIYGTQEISAAPEEGGRGAKIFAPNGFLAASDRVSIYMSNLYLLGDLTASIYGVDGPIGGNITGCYLDSYERLINNNFAYFLTFYRTKFGESEIGLALAVANSTNITKCFFASSCELKIDSGFTLTAFDGISNSGGAPLNIHDCGFNINTVSGSVALKLKGGGSVTENYFEIFSGAGTGREMIHWQPRRNAYDTVKCNDNRLSNQGQCDRFLRLWSDNALGTVTSGEVKRNLVRGCTSKPFIFGDIAGLANPLVSGIDISSNNYDTTDQIDYTSVFNHFAPQIQGGYSGSLNITGGSFVNVPLTRNASNSLGGEDSGGDLYVRVEGWYVLETRVVVQTTASDYPNLEIRFRKTGASIRDEIRPLIYGGITTKMEISFKTTVYATIADFFEVQARNGETLLSVDSTLSWVRK